MAVTTVSSLPKSYGERMCALGMWQEACPIPLERLSLIKIRYVDFQGNEHDNGELVAFDVAAEQMAKIFDKLYTMRFPINKIVPVHEYDGNDDRSMADNNSSCFNFRTIANTTTVSIHSYGVAIDLNPEQNPMITFDDKGVATIHPQQGWTFLNRNNRKPGMIEDIVMLMAEHGFFVWGGNWTTPIDYHHFQTPRGIAELLAAVNREDGERLLDACIEHRQRLLNFPTGAKIEPLIEIYRKNRSSFMDAFVQWIEKADSQQSM